jgi:hypothetical protein
VFQLQPQQLEQRQVLLVADAAVVQDAGFDAEALADEPVSERGRDGVWVRVVLQHDGVLLTPVRLQQPLQHARAVRGGLRRPVTLARRFCLPGCHLHLLCVGFQSGHTIGTSTMAITKIITVSNAPTFKKSKNR